MICSVHGVSKLRSTDMMLSKANDKTKSDAAAKNSRNGLPQSQAVCSAK